MNMKAIKYVPHLEDAILCDMYIAIQHGTDGDIADWLNSGTSADRVAYVKERRAAIANGTAASIINKAGMDQFDKGCRELNQVQSTKRPSLDNLNEYARGHYLVRITADDWMMAEHLIANLMKAANVEHAERVRVDILDKWHTGTAEDGNKPFWMCVTDSYGLEYDPDWDIGAYFVLKEGGAK